MPQDESNTILLMLFQLQIEAEPKFHLPESLHNTFIEIRQALRPDRFISGSFSVAKIVRAVINPVIA